MIASAPCPSKTSRGDAVQTIFDLLQIQREDHVVKAQWGQPFVCPTTGDTVLWIERPGVEGHFKVRLKVEQVPPFVPQSSVEPEVCTWCNRAMPDGCDGKLRDIGAPCFLNRPKATP